MNLADILSEDQIITNLKAVDRWEAIDELINLLVATGKVQEQHRDQVIAAVRKRESSLTTGIGLGIGLPHASTEFIDEVVGTFGRSKIGVQFDTMDNQPVNLVVLFLVPQGQFQKHLNTLANIAKLLQQKNLRQAMMEAPDAKSIYELIKGQCES